MNGKSPSLLHTWPERLLLGFAGLTCVAFLGLVSTTLSLRDSQARLEATVAALQRQVDRIEGTRVARLEDRR